MDTITLSKKIYKDLMEKALRYQYILSLMQSQASIFSPPPVKNSKQIAKEFESTGLYNKQFIKSLEGGLKRSNYFTQ